MYQCKRMEWHPCLSFSFFSGPVRRSCEWLSHSLIGMRKSKGRAKSSRDFALTTLRRLAHNPLSSNFDEHSILPHNKTINTVTSKAYLTTHYAIRITHPSAQHNAHLSSSSP
jgi:hypothetical protein